MQLSEERIKKLKALACRECWFEEEDSVIDDYAGGNVDDAHTGGMLDGEACLAREILDELGIEY